MSTRRFRLEDLRIPNPCPADWNQMIGDNRKRFCERCQKFVYDFSQMPRRRAEALVEATRGQLCARITRYSDGTVRTAEPVTSPALYQIQRPSPIVAALVAATLSFGAAVPSTRAAQQAPVAQTTTQPSKDALAEPAGESSEVVLYGVINEVVNISAESLATLTAGGVVVRWGPSPLRELYRESELAVIASVGHSVIVEADEDTQLMKTELHVTSTIKGKAKRVVYLYHRIKTDDPAEFAFGDEVLAFLNRREKENGRKEKNGYEEIRPSGIKKLSPDKMLTYKQRLTELVAMPANDETELVEWLVRCAEDPATRWEGAYELRRAVESLADFNEEMREQFSDDVSPDESGTNPARNDDPPVMDEDAQLAALLTEEQKERLKSALFNSDLTVAGDKELLDIVRAWGDERLLPFMLDRIERLPDAEETLRSSLIETIYEMSDEPEIEAAYDAFSEAKDSADALLEEADENADRQAIEQEVSRRITTAAKVFAHRVRAYLAAKRQ